MIAKAQQGSGGAMNTLLFLVLGALSGLAAGGLLSWVWVAQDMLFRSSIGASMAKILP